MISSRFWTLRRRAQEPVSLIFGREPQPPELGHDVPVTDLSSPMLVNDGEQINWIARTAADLPVAFDSSAWSGWRVASSLAGPFSTGWLGAPGFHSTTFLVQRRLRRAFLPQSDVSEARETKDIGLYPSSRLAERRRAFAM